MSWRTPAAALATALWMAACATVAPPGPTVGGETLAGRLAVKVDADAGHPARSETAAFELQGGTEAGRMRLSTPLGSVLAEARWSPEAVVLATPQGERRFADLDGLTREVLGESVPVAPLFDWLHGRPWPGAQSVASTPPAVGFSQLGWNVDLARFGDGLVVAQRSTPPPAVTVRAKIDNP